MLNLHKSGDGEISDFSSLFGLSLWFARVFSVLEGSPFLCPSSPFKT